MQILLLTLEADKDTAHRLEEELTSRNFDVTLRIVSKECEDHLLREMEDHENVVVVYGPESSKMPWASFSAGWLVGRKNPGLLYIPPEFELPPQAEGVFVTPDMSAVFDYFERERVFWEERKRRKDAEAALASMGYSYNQDAFAFAVAQGNIKAVKQYLHGGLSPEGCDASGTPLLCLAARNHRIPVLKKLLETGVDVNIRSRDRGNTALMDAAAQGSLAICAILISRGADLNVASKNDQTALILASGAKSEPVVRLLLKEGANPLPKDKLGMAARDYIKLFKLEGVIDECREAEEQWGKSVSDSSPIGGC